MLPEARERETSTIRRIQARNGLFLSQFARVHTYRSFPCLSLTPCPCPVFVPLPDEDYLLIDPLLRPHVYQIANVARIMKDSLPLSAKISKESKECLQECVSEFIMFVVRMLDLYSLMDVVSSQGFDTRFGPTQRERKKKNRQH